MRAPTANHVEGFFLGLAHAEKIADTKRRGQTSSQVIAIRREYTRMALAAGRPVLERKAQGSASGTLPQSHKTPLGIAALVLCGLLSMWILTSLAFRAADIESEWRNDRLCKIYGVCL